MLARESLDAIFELAESLETRVDDTYARFRELNATQEGYLRGLTTSLVAMSRRLDYEHLRDPVKNPSLARSPFFHPNFVPESVSSSGRGSPRNDSHHSRGSRSANSESSGICTPREHVDVDEGLPSIHESGVRGARPVPLLDFGPVSEGNSPTRASRSKTVVGLGFSPNRQSLGGHGGSSGRQSAVSDRMRPFARSFSSMNSARNLSPEKSPTKQSNKVAMSERRPGPRGGDTSNGQPSGVTAKSRDPLRLSTGVTGASSAIAVSRNESLSGRVSRGERELSRRRQGGSAQSRREEPIRRLNLRFQVVLCYEDGYEEVEPDTASDYSDDVPHDVFLERLKKEKRMPELGEYIYNPNDPNDSANTSRTEIDYL